MRVHELAKQLSSELGKTIASSEIIVKLNKKKEGLKPQSSVSEELIEYVRSLYISAPKKEAPKKEVPKKEAPKKETAKTEIKNSEAQKRLCATEQGKAILSAKNKGKVWINKEGVSKLVTPAELDKYLLIGCSKGRGGNR